MKKKTKLTQACLLLLATSSASLNGAILATESFDYPDGALSGSNGGSGWSTPWGSANGNTASIQGSVVGNAYTSANGTIFRGLDFTFGDHDNIWISVDYERAASGGVFGGLQLFAGTSEVALIGNLGAGGGVNGQWTLASDGNLNNVIDTGVSSMTIKTSVIHYDIVNNTGEIWVGAGVGPVDITAPSDATISGLNLAGVNTIRLGEAGAGSIIDSIQIGTTAFDVAAIPEPSTTALLGSLLILLSFNRRRQ